MIHGLGSGDTGAGRSKRQQLDRLLTVTAPRERLALALTALLLLAFLAWGLFGRIEHTVTLDGVLIAPGTRHDAVSAEPGHLLELLVAPGDRIEAGTPVARQSVPQLDREANALRARLELLEREAAQADDNAGRSMALLESARTALFELEARRSARETIVTHNAGEVMTLLAEPGDYLLAGASVARVRTSSPDANREPIQAVLRVVPELAQRIRPGMQASVALAMPGDELHVLEAEIAAVAAEPLPKWVAALQPLTEEDLRRIDVEIHAAPEFSVPDGAACRVRIVLGRIPLVALLDSERL